MIRLAYGVVAGRGLGVWAPGPDGAARDAAEGDLPAGTPVVVGRRGAERADVVAALTALRELVSRGGELLAGADVDLGGGFRTGRLAGGAGDRRDAVLAALRVLGADGAARLGDRASVLVALFGPAATKRVGGAATAALHDGRWPALFLASAASDLLGPEHVERVLALADPLTPSARTVRGAGDEYGLASRLAVDLDRVLSAYQRPRRLTLLLDLCGVVATQRRAAERQERLRTFRHSDERIDRVRARYERHVDDEVIALLPPGARPIDLARWIPQRWHWERWFINAMRDALAATVLLRAAIAVAEDGLADGVARVRPLFAAGARLLSDHEASVASRRVPDLVGVPARPGVYVREIDRRLTATNLAGERIDGYLAQRIALARDYGIVVLEAVRSLLEEWSHAADAPPRVHWVAGLLRPWRDVAGYTATRRPQEWQQPMLGLLGTEDAPIENAGPLAQRLLEHPDAAASDLETPGDLVWYAELADALAQIDGYEVATVEYGEPHPYVSTAAWAPAIEPLRPVADSVPRAVAGAAQLLELGAAAPTRPRSWPELIDGLMTSTVVAEALTGAFAVPRSILDRDGTVIPGSDARIEIARDPHQLVAWAQYMGNCISGPYYLGEALRGRSVLAALVGPDGRPVANVELRPRRADWIVNEFRARFNNDPAPAIDSSLRAWVATLPPPQPTRRGPAPATRVRPGDHRPYQPNRELADLRHALVPLAARALDADEVRRALDVLSPLGGGAADGIVAVTALRRAARAELDGAVRGALADGLDLLELWRATAVRPLAVALAGLDRTLRDRTVPLGLLLGDEPLPALHRRLARVAPIAQARTVEVVARRLRRSLGRLARGDDPELAAVVPRRSDAGLLCALVLTVSTAATVPTEALTPITRAGQAEVPGFPASNVDDRDGPWRRARADATELGAELPRGRARPALLVPTSWLGRGGWPALWARASRVRQPGLR